METLRALYNHKRLYKKIKFARINMKEKILVCFFGTISRSIKYTYKNIETNIINPLQNHYQVDVYVFNNNVHGMKVDGVIQNNDDIKVIPTKFFEEISQTEMDLQIEKKISSNNIVCEMVDFYSKATIQNALRQMYAEEQVGNFLNKKQNEYKIALVSGPDFYFLNKLDIQNVIKSPVYTNAIFTSVVCDAMGYTNGFYFGCITPMVKILKRFSILEMLLPSKHDYEALLKKTFELHNVERMRSTVEFVKIRSNKKVRLIGKTKSPRYKAIVEEISKAINT